LVDAIRDIFHGRQTTPSYCLCLQLSRADDNVVQSNDINFQSCSKGEEPVFGGVAEVKCQMWWY